VTVDRPGAPGRDPAAPEATEDPLAADKRTLTIGAVAMVGLILVGVVSAQLFARGGCAAVVDPQRAPAVDATQDPTEVAAGLLGADVGPRVLELVEQVAGAPVTTAVDVGDASGIARLDDGLLVTGATVTSFDRSLAPAATFDTDDPVVGDGPAVYDVVLPNTRTGQTDALVPLVGPDLRVGTCVDTAVVGSPFAFLLDAGGGQLLLLRADEDGDSPDLQLRDADRGAVWDSRLTLPSGPPGTLAERLTATLGPDVVVAARRVGPQETDPAPALVIVDREDGTVLAEVDHADLAADAMLDADQPVRWRALAVGTDTALVEGRPDPSDGEEGSDDPTGTLLLLDLGTAETLVAEPDRGPVTDAVAHPEGDPDRYAVATVGDGGGEVVVLDPDGRQAATTAASFDDVHLAWLGDQVTIAAGGALGRLDPAADATEVEQLDGIRFRALTTTPGGRTAVLVAGDDAPSALLVVTTRAGELADDPAASEDA
jgi:hypothetical protein